MTYDTPDATALARRVAGLMPDTEPVHQHASRGLDHGAWVPLKLMYPDADIPVLQMSHADPRPGPTAGDRPATAAAARGGRAGRRVRLPDPRAAVPHRVAHRRGVPGWSADFDAWAGEALARGDVDTLSDYRSKAPGMPYAHPTVEHFSPLFVTLGAATAPDEPGLQVVDGFWMGLSKRSLQVA